jgi:hypothetical protein
MFVHVFAPRPTTGGLCRVRQLARQTLPMELIAHHAENLAAHRAQILTAILPVAVAFGAAEVEPDREPLRVSLVSVADDGY